MWNCNRPHCGGCVDVTGVRSSMSSRRVTLTSQEAERSVRRKQDADSNSLNTDDLQTRPPRKPCRCLNPTCLAKLVQGCAGGGAERRLKG